ncbi:CheA signal transduction histidine kinase [Gloeothece citriformis PCC 7424]|uniref:histidine kinase n=1 Tax=Gloeothece citriformis (strain PCC 7424) TaxID=65393 RepID=B7KBI6_GLOC7|nr:hybrid sensor histidine kinase/response regulator [Gloeothece citriformis]ACK72964.1 CheA signal transduction histidine kinase [Gloeothece citriformis PCC 7424]
MDIGQEVRLNFIEEADNCLDRLESVLLQLSTTVVEKEQFDLALRAAHSVKGGAAMMGFNTLSQITHRLEDFLKILRVRYQGFLIETEIESLLLQGLDCLRQICDFHRQEQDREPSWVIDYSDTIFDRLSQFLGELQPADEDVLMFQEENVNPALLLFEQGVSTLLEQLESQLNVLPDAELHQKFIQGSEQLTEFALMADIPTFINLCQSIQYELLNTPSENILPLADRALKLWQRSHALITLGRWENIPQQIDLPSEFSESENKDNQSWEFGSIDVLETHEELATDESENTSFSDFALSAFGEEELTEWQEILTLETEKILTDLDSKTADLPVIATQTLTKQTDRMFRLSVEQMNQFNRLFEDLILERNGINLRLEQLKTFVSLMWERMNRLEMSNQLLRRWYDGASLAGIVPSTVPASSSSSTENFQGSALSKSTNVLKQQFDVLEMAQYTDLHLISQDQIETIVQLREVATDIDLSLQDINQTVREFNQTTQSLYNNLLRSQMRPFGDSIKHFPRVMRDLSLQFGKSVNLKIEGENTLIDKSILEVLSDPLNHLLRNAFDHGIEETYTRLAMGKPPQGTITLKAFHRGNQTIITIQDDGQGINLSKIRSRLIEQGFSETEVQRMEDSELLNQIFEPGFTTTEQVTELSGRGVGMDVVQTKLKEIRGQIQVDSQAGLGTTFTLVVPFTLSVLRVMVVESNSLVFAIAADTIKSVIQLQPEQIFQKDEQETIVWEQQSIPLIRLGEKFSFTRPCKPLMMTGTPIINQPLALIIDNGKQIQGIYLERFWAEEDVTIRSIVSPIILPPGFNQSIIWGDGRVIPLVDLLECVQSLDNYSQSSNYLSSNSLLEKDIKTVLVVDDSVNVRRYLAFTLDKAGYQVELAKDGQEAVDKLMSGISVEAVICDLEMPRLDGYGVLEILRQHSQFETLPIIMLTSRSNDKHRKLAMNLGANAYFSKPYTEQELLKTLEQLISVA